MPDEIYEIISMAARYWFLFLMALIAFRSYRWFSKDRKKYKKRIKHLPDAGYIGELVVVKGDDDMPAGTCLSVSREGILGYYRNADICVPTDGIANKHLWYSFDETDGLRVEPFRGRRIIADGSELIGSRMHAFLGHGSRLSVGQAVFRLRMFSGFETAGLTNASRMSLGTVSGSEIPSPSARVQRMHELAAWQTMMEEDEREYADTDSAYDDVASDDFDEFSEYDDAEEMPDDTPVFYPPVIDDHEYDNNTEFSDDEYDIEYKNEYGIDDEETSTQTDGSSDCMYEDVQADDEGFYPIVTDPQDAPELDENGEPPKSMYIEEDEAALAKRVVWDKYFRGGQRK